MVTLRCTRRLLDRLGAVPSSAAVSATTRLGDWYGQLIPLRKARVLCMNERTLLCTLVPAAPIATLLDRWVEETGVVLEMLNVPAGLIRQELAAMHSPAIGATVNRRVLGCLNEATRVVRWITPRDPLDVPIMLESLLADYAYSAIGHERPADLARLAFGLLPPSSQ